MTDKADRQIAAARRLVDHLARALDADLSVRLWNGERLPLGSRVSDDLGFAINTPQALTRLVRRPSFTTIIELLADGSIEIEGGTLIDVAHRRGQMRTKGLLRRLDKLMLVRNLAPFAFKSLKASESQAFAGQIETSVEKGRDDKALIGFHYDLSNAFYGLFLDERMVYTCAYFETDHEDIAEAQRAKLDMICRKLRVKEGDRFLDIGCGWGALVIHAAQNFGAISHGVTLSEEQHAFAQAPHRGAGPARPRQSGIAATIDLSKSPPASTRSPPSACSSMWAFPTTTRTSGRCTGCCGRAGSTCIIRLRARPRRT